MKNCIFTGACTALVTPFLEGKVNYPMLERLLQRQIDAGIRAVVIAGTTGAGDAFAAAYLASWLKTHDVMTALQAGNANGAKTASHAGAF